MIAINACVALLVAFTAAYTALPFSWATWLLEIVIVAGGFHVLERLVEDRVAQRIAQEEDRRAHG